MGQQQEGSTGQRQLAGRKGEERHDPWLLPARHASRMEHQPGRPAPAGGSRQHMAGRAPSGAAADRAAGCAARRASSLTRQALGLWQVDVGGAHHPEAHRGVLHDAVVQAAQGVGDEQLAGGPARGGGGRGGGGGRAHRPSRCSLPAWVMRALPLACMHAECMGSHCGCRWHSKAVQAGLTGGLDRALVLPGRAVHMSIHTGAS